MSMIAHFRIVTPAVRDDLAEYDDEQMAQFLFPEDEESDTTQDIDKAWDAIDHLLAAATQGQLTTLLGGSELGPDLGYGPARCMAPDEVRAVASMLSNIDSTSLLEHYDPAALTSADVYPSIWDDSQEIRDYIGENFRLVRRLFLEAARQDAAVLAWLA